MVNVDVELCVIMFPVLGQAYACVYDHMVFFSQLHFM